MTTPNEKSRVRDRTRYAIKKGVIERKPCEICGSKKAEAHHDDYLKPLDVQWFCKRCHGRRHIKLNLERTQRKREDFIMANVPEYRKQIQESLKNYNDVLTEKDVAEILKIPLNRVRYLRSESLIKSFPIDPTVARKTWRFLKVDLEEYLLNNKLLMEVKK